MSNAAKKLPPLPRSDSKSLGWNAKDNYYGVRSRDFWNKNELVSEEVEPFEKCDHEFSRTPEGVRCQKCNFGLIGHGLEIREGKLFYNNEPLDF